MGKTWKRVLSLVMATVLTSVLCVPAMADETGSSGGVVTTWSELQEALNSGGCVTLGANITASADDEALVVPEDTEATLDLNGYTIDRALTEGTYHGYVIRVEGVLAVQDTSSAQSGKITGGRNGKDNKGDSAGGGIYVDSNATLNLNGGQIAGNKAYSGGGVYVEGAMTMTGGAIAENEATNEKSDGGGGVKIAGGTLAMSAGSISGNKAARYGGGVSVWRAFSKQGSFTMTGGKVGENGFSDGSDTDNQVGGGVYARSSNVTLSGGEISGNTANEGAGVYLKGESGDKRDSTLTMNDKASITKNTSSACGGGIYVGNYSIAMLQSGSISQNKSGKSGAGVYFGSVSHGDLRDISISRNAITSGSSRGAGLSASDDVKVSGSPRIEVNYNANFYVDNVYIPSDGSALKVVGALGDEASIGIANGGSFSHYAAAGSGGYAITESDRGKFSSDTALYAVKPLNTEVTGNRVELGESWPVVLGSDNVIVASESAAGGPAILQKIDDRAKAWKDEPFVFSVEPAEGYAKTGDFSVTYKVDGGKEVALTADEGGTYSIPAQSKRTNLYVKGIERQYTVSFESNGGSVVEPQKVFGGGYASEPEVPARNGYSFEGWFSDAACEAPWDFEGNAITGDVVLYAKWKAIPSAGGGSSTSYRVDVNSSANGSVTADRLSAAKGTTVTITAVPDEGYKIGKLTVTDKDGNAVLVTSKGDGRYAFVMPAGKVVVDVSFEQTDWGLGYRNCPKDDACPIWPFSDAITTDWYHDGVHFCLENGLMVGFGNNIFQPDTSTTRAMLTVMLWRLNGSPVVDYDMGFDDVPADQWYTEAIRWAACEGVAMGYDNGKFGPDDVVTREQTATILWRYVQHEGYDVDAWESADISSYSDADSVSQYAVPAMRWACGSGMIAGVDQGDSAIIDPQGGTARAQMATMMMRFCAEIVK